MSDQPVIDVHLHCYTELEPGIPVDFAQRPESEALVSPASAEEHRDRTLAEMDRHNVVRAMVSGSEKAVRQWHEAAPDRFIGGIGTGDDWLPEPSVEELESLVDDGLVGVLGELGLQYGEYRRATTVSLRISTIWSGRGYRLLCTPVSGRLVALTPLHHGSGSPLGRPTLLEPVLASRPGLKAWLMHAGWPYLEDTIAMLYMYPNL